MAYGMNHLSKLASVLLSRRVITVICTCVILCVAMAALVAQEKKAKRAKQKYFKKSESKVFFTDVFDNFVGARPDFNAVAEIANNGGDPSAPGTSALKSGGFAWSEIVSANAIESEMKALKLSIDGDVTTPSEFKGRGYLECRRHFSMVAALMGVINDYDKDIRWKEPAAAVRDVFSRSAGNAKVGTQQTYNESKIRKQDMQDIIGGANFVGESSDPANNWEVIVDRPPLMERISIAFEEKLQPSIANEDEFKKLVDEMKHEAEILAMLSEILSLEGMEDAGDETYDGYAQSMKTGAVDYAQALKDGDYAKARAAAGVMGQACSNCHNEYQ
jgi:hypothetical protein